MAALDLIASAIHVTTGDSTMNFLSGVDFIAPEVLKERTANLLCPVSPSYQNRVDELKAQCAAERDQCAVDKSLNAASVLQKLQQGTIKVVFDSN